MMAIALKNWSDTYSEPMSAESIARIHVPARRYRINRCEYKPHERISGAAIAGVIYVIRGDMRFTLTTDECQPGLIRESVDLRSGHIVEFLGGEYTLEVESSGGAIAVFVCKIPNF